MSTSRIIIESIKLGTIASLAMMPFGFIFRVAELRVGHYGPKFAGLFVDDPSPLFLFAQHIVLGWLSALPLIAFFVLCRVPTLHLGWGALYGVLYYIAVNSLMLPLYFGDPLPWQLGIATIIPSLVVHIVFGATLGLFGRKLCEVDVRFS
jgi:uncharacterized membrane protein YagU involved in acid resistance